MSVNVQKIDGLLQLAGNEGTTNYTELQNKPTINNVELSGNKSLNDIGAMSNTITHLSGDIATEEKGAANGVATLGSDSKVPAAQLPSYVDDVLEYNGKSSFPTTGESGKIYVDTSDNKTYRWSGSAYVEISPSLALGETSSTAYAGDKGKANATAIAALQTAVNALPTSYPANGGIAANVSGTVAIANGGTGATTAANARTNLGLGTAAVKSVDTSISTGSTSANLPTSAAVASYVEGLIGNINTLLEGV